MTSLAMRTICRPSGYWGVFIVTSQASMPTVLVPGRGREKVLSEGGFNCVIREGGKGECLCERLIK